MRLALLMLLFLAVWLPASRCQDKDKCPPHTSAFTRPNPCTWRSHTNHIFGYSPRFLDWLIAGCELKHDASCHMPKYRSVEHQGYDGWYNNLGRPDLGATETPLLRLLSPAYSDGVYKPVERKANPLEVSQRLSKGKAKGQYSKTGLTAFSVFFGQQVVEEMMDAQGTGCPPEYFNIKINKNHDFHKEKPHLWGIPFLRTRYDTNTGHSPNNPRQQLNGNTPYLDGGTIYGTTKGWSDVLRVFADGRTAPRGKLAWHELDEGSPARNTQRLPMNNPPAPTHHEKYTSRGHTDPVDRFFKLGNSRGNENPFLLSMGIMWFRWHNFIAEYLDQKYGQRWNDEQIFNEARKWVIATYQSIVAYDWFPKFVQAKLPKYQQYNPSIDPQISHVFQAAAMRYGHTLVPSGGYMRETSKQGCHSRVFNLGPKRPGSTGVRTCNSFWRATELFNRSSDNFEQFMAGLSSQSSEREDSFLVKDLRERIFGPLEFSRRDLMAINIQRGRDHGLPDYNAARKHFGLTPLKSLNAEEFKTVTHTEVEDSILRELKALYDDPSQVDIWVGGLLETKKGPGQLFTKVILDQFERVRDGDRFWFENKDSNLFTEQEISRLQKVKIIDVVLSVTQLFPGEDIQEDPFTAVNENNVISQECFDKMRFIDECKVNDTDKCYFWEQLDDSNTEHCTGLETYDYFEGSELSFILTFLFLLGLCCCFPVIIYHMTKTKRQTNPDLHLNSRLDNDTSLIAIERVAQREKRIVKIILDADQKRILVENPKGDLLRVIDLTHIQQFTIKHLKNDFNLMIFKITNHYDLFLKFKGPLCSHPSRLKGAVDNFCSKIDCQVSYQPESKTALYLHTTTFKDRQQKLAEFSKHIVATVFKDNQQGWQVKGSNIDAIKQDILSMEITKIELANQLGLESDSDFVQQLFDRMDKDKNGFLTFNEIWGTMLVFAKGTIEEKATLMFNICDLSQKGYISAQDLIGIVRSTQKRTKNGRNIENMADTFLESVNLKSHQTISLEKFKSIFQSSQTFQNMILNLDEKTLTRKDTCCSLYTESGAFPKDHSAKRSQEQDEEINEQQYSNPIMENFHSVGNQIKNNEQYLFWMCLYFIVTLLIFAERFYTFLIEREYSGLRRVTSVGVSFTRGAASAMMFNFSTLLVTMCRNLFSILKSTICSRYLPLDHMNQFHSTVGSFALFWTIIHVVGHSVNFYHISTQTPRDLTCLFTEYFRATDVIPKFHYWCFQTITGMAGILLTILTTVIYAFAYSAKRHFFTYFWWSHIISYPIFFLLLILHGSGRLVQDPFIHYFFVGACLLFFIDKMASKFRSRMSIDVISAKHLPSDVIELKIHRPFLFNYEPGQWVRIAAKKISWHEYHPFTLSSAPHEEYLTLHIRKYGPWTEKLKTIYPNIPVGKYPPIYMDGPFGSPHQAWWNFQVVIFVAGGIGVTPFSSILKDISHKLTYARSQLKIKKVVFLWVTPNEKEFEWMTDVLKKVEDSDMNGIIDSHVFITEMKSKYDLRTVMLYMAERHFQTENGKSLFTGLRATTHFGRPDFPTVFEKIQKKYNPNKTIPMIGVFSCGNNAMSDAVDFGCQKMNNETAGVFFKHHYEHF